MGYIENKILGRDINSATGTANTTTYLRGDDSWGEIDVTGKVDKITWTHAAGTVGSFNEESSIGTIQIGGTSGIDGSALTASNTTALPSGISLSSAGALTGTHPNITANLTSSFTVSVTDGTNSDTRVFTITNIADDDVPTWNTTSGALAEADGTGYSVQLSATDPEGLSLTYTIFSGSLPAGLSLSSSGLISGTASTLDGSTSTFTVRVTDSVNNADRSFNITAAEPSLTVEATIVGGGGAGGSDMFGARSAGAGGGGGHLVTSGLLISGATSVTVGAGGSGHSSTTDQASNGGDSTIAGHPSGIGGGGGGSHDGSGWSGSLNWNGNPGGSGGSGCQSGSGGTGVPGQGYPVPGSGGGGYGNWHSQGGAGAGGPNSGSTGGSGTTSWDGTPRSGGGGGLPSGGTQGGGAGAVGQGGNTNSGGGAGGLRSGQTARSGGSGVVIIRYPGGTQATGGTISASGGYTYHKFTTSGTFTNT